MKKQLSEQIASKQDEIIQAFQQQVKKEELKSIEQGDEKNAKPKSPQKIIIQIPVEKLLESGKKSPAKKNPEQTTVAEKPIEVPSSTPQKPKGKDSPTKSKDNPEVPKPDIKKPSSPSKEMKTSKSVSLISTQITEDKEGDKVMNVTTIKPKKDKKRKRDKDHMAGEEPTKRVRFDLTQNKVTEFFKYGKVATRPL